MTEISDLPMHHDIDADYTPLYLKLARILRNKIESGEDKRGDALPAFRLGGHKHKGVGESRMERACNAAHHR